MPEIPVLQFFLADRGHPVVPGGKPWMRFLPQDRQAAPCRPGTRALTCGAYFEAVSRFLARNDWQGLGRAGIAANTDWPSGRPPSHIDIYLEKHGAFYHPCRVAAAYGRHRTESVVNVAVSPEGCDLLPKEVGLIENLRRRFDLGYLPAVFDCGEAALPDGRRLPMFLGQWFSHFCEFHLTATVDQSQAMVAWTPAGPHRLDKNRRRDLYRQAAAILTGYYDIFSGEQILDWHHAAGDFVVRLDHDSPPALRLVTVRRYESLLKAPPGDLETTLAALALFLVHTTLWLRLDRCDGVGDLMLAGPEAVAAAVDGVLDALRGKVDRREIPGEMLTAAAAHLSTCRQPNLVAPIMALAARRPDGDPTRTLFENIAVDHAGCLQQALEAGTRFYRP